MGQDKNQEKNTKRKEEKRPWWTRPGTQEWVPGIESPLTNTKGPRNHISWATDWGRYRAVPAAQGGLSRSLQDFIRLRVPSGRAKREKMSFSAPLARILYAVEEC